MVIHYNIYANDGRGGPVDYASAIATTEALTFTTPPLPPSSDTTFAVRALDPATGLEEANTEARVRVVLDADGRDVSARPNAPTAPTVRATAGGGCLATWGYHPAGQGGAPSAFQVFLTEGAVPDFAAPAATVPYRPGRARSSCPLAGLSDGVAYTVAVRAVNASGPGPVATAVAAVVGKSTPPGNVDALVGAATFGAR